MPGADILGKRNNLNNKYYKNKYSLQDVGNKINKKKLNVTSSNGSKKSFKKKKNTQFWEVVTKPNNFFT